MRNHPLLAFILGAWLGGSLLAGAAVPYNFAGFADLFARNPRLAQAAGFDPADTLRFCLLLTAAGMLLCGRPRTPAP